MGRERHAGIERPQKKTASQNRARPPVQRVEAPGPAMAALSSPSALLELQRTVGNAAVNQLLRQHALQRATAAVPLQAGTPLSEGAEHAAAPLQRHGVHAVASDDEGMARRQVDTLDAAPYVIQRDFLDAAEWKQATKGGVFKKRGGTTPIITEMDALLATYRDKPKRRKKTLQKITGKTGEWKANPNNAKSNRLGVITQLEQDAKAEYNKLIALERQATKQKLNSVGVADNTGNTIVLPNDDVFDAATTKTLKSFQKAYGLPETGKVNAATKAALNATRTTHSQAYTEVVGGVTYAATAGYDWAVTDNQVHITVKINFTGSPPNKDAVVTRWFNAIKVTWNQFKAVKKGGAMSRDIVFDPQNTGGSAHHTVAVMPGTGRSNAAQWFVTAQDQVAGHEFGHLIGLPDEYQLSHGDYVSTIGEAPDKGKKTGDAPSATIAQELRAALLTKVAEQSAAHAEYTAAADDAGRNVAEAKFNTARSDRAAAVRAVVAGHTLKQGNFARRIGTAYKKAFGTDLVSDLVSNIPSADQWSIINPFTYSAGGTMGDFFSKDENNAPGSTDTAGHTHSVAPRHMRMFVSYAQHAKGGVWEAERK